MNSCVQIITSDDNNPPKANFSINQKIGTTNTDFIFDGSFSSDDNDEIKSLNYFWEYYSIYGRRIDSAYGILDTACFQDTGKYVISLTVFDSDSLSDTKDDTIKINQHTDPVFVLIDSCINFGPVEIDFIVTEKLSLTNLGNDTLRISAVYFTGTNKNAFTCDFDTEIIIMPDSTKNLLINFAPIEVGDYESNININSNDPKLSNKKICIKGQGFNDLYYIEFINIENDSLGFDNIKVGLDSTYSIILKNTGEDDREILAAYIVGEGRNSFKCDFSSEFIIGAGEEGSLDISFSPQDTLIYSASLIIKSDDEFSKKKEIQLTGKGFTTNPIIQINNVEDDTLNFGNIETAFKTIYPIEIMNIGEEVLDVSAIFITGSDKENFSCDFNQSFSVNPNESSELNIQFLPDENKFYEAEININSNDLQFSNKKIYLKGQGFTDLFYIEIINIDNDSLEFGELKVGLDSTFSVILKNTDENNREILAAYIVEEGKNSFQCEFSSEFIINAGEERNLDITFSPQDTLFYSALLVIKSDNEFSTKKEIILTGKGTNRFPSIQISNVENDTLNFGNIEATLSSTLPLEISNIGDEVVDISAIFITGIDNENFHCDFNQNFSLNPNESNTINIQFSPDLNRSYLAELKILSIDGQLIKRIYLSGNGVQRDLQIIYPIGHDLFFGEIEVGKDTVIFVELENKGDDVVIIEDSYIVMDNNNVFSCNFLSEFEIKPGHKEQIAVTFSPSDTLDYSAELVIKTDEIEGNKKTLQISGKGYKRIFINIDKKSLIFGNVLINTSSTKNFNVHNKADYPLNIYSVYLSGPDKNYFSSDFGSEVTMQPNDSITINVMFTPTSDNPMGRNYIHVVNNSPNNSIGVVELVGQGSYPPEIETIDTLDFGEVNLHNNKMLNLSINNIGSVNISNLTLSLDNEDFIFQLDQPVDIMIGASIDVDIYFNPRSYAGDIEATLLINSENFGVLKEVVLKGKALAN